MQDRLEALADAIADLNGWGDPSSRAYQLRNPLLLRALSLVRLQAQDPKGYREFQSFHAGYRAGLFDLRVKLSGDSRADVTGAGGVPTLHGVLRAYGLGHVVAVKRCLRFLERALTCSDGSIHGDTPGAWFLQTSANAVEPLEGERIAAHAGR